MSRPFQVIEPSEIYIVNTSRIKPIRLGLEIVVDENTKPRSLLVHSENLHKEKRHLLISI